MTISNNNVSATGNNGIYAPNSKPKAESIKQAFLTQVVTDVGGEEAALAGKIMQDDFFQAGIGLKSLGYTFLLLKTFCALEVEMMKSSNEQMKLTSAMYTQMAETEKRIAEDTWKSSLAKGISQIGAGVTAIATHSYGVYAQRKELESSTAKAKIEKVNTDQVKVGGVINGPPVPDTKVKVTNPDQPDSEPAKTTKADGDQEVPEQAPSKDALARAREKGEYFQMLARSLGEIIGGAGTIAGGYFDAEAKREEAVKHLIQSVISNADTSQRRAQQQYEEAAKKVEEAIQMYTAALQASH